MTRVVLLASVGTLSSCYARCADDEVRADDGRCYATVDDEPDTSPPEDTDVDRGVARLEGRTEDCADGVWSYLADAGPSPGAATIEVADDVRSESHPMALSDASHWQLSATLPVVPLDEQKSGVSTAFPCEARDALTWRLELWDTNGLWSDCTVWGADPERLADDRCVTW